MGIFLVHFRVLLNIYIYICRSEELAEKQEEKQDEDKEEETGLEKQNDAEGEAGEEAWAAWRVSGESGIPRSARR